MDKALIDAIDYIDMAVNKTEQFKNDYSPEMSSKVLDNRIITLEAYIRYIERETMPVLENVIDILEVEYDG